MDRLSNFTPTYYKVRWNHYARAGRLATRLFWIIVPIGTLTLLVSLLANINWIAQGAFFVVTGLIVSMAILLQVDRMRSVEKMRELAVYALRISSPIHTPTTFLYNSDDEIVCQSDELLPAPRGFPRAAWLFPGDDFSCNSWQVGKSYASLTCDLVLMNFTQSELLAYCPFGPAKKLERIRAYMLEAAMSQAEMTSCRAPFNINLESEPIYPWRVKSAIVSFSPVPMTYEDQVPVGP